MGKPDNNAEAPEDIMVSAREAHYLCAQEFPDHPEDEAGMRYVSFAKFTDLSDRHAVALEEINRLRAELERQDRR